MENEYVKAIKLNHLSGSDLTKEGSLILFYKIPICFDLIQKIPSVELLVVNLSLCQPRHGEENLEKFGVIQINEDFILCEIITRKPSLLFSETSVISEINYPKGKTRKIFKR